MDKSQAIAQFHYWENVLKSYGSGSGAIHIRVPEERTTQAVWLRGVDTSDWTNGRRVALGERFLKVAGTHQYKTANGGTNTVKLLETFRLSDYEAGLSKIKVPIRNKASDIERRLTALESTVTTRLRMLSAEAQRKQQQEKAKAEKAATDKKAEQNAESLLIFAQMVLKDGQKAQAINRLERIVKDFPGTKAAGEAAKLLKEIK